MIGVHELIIDCDCVHDNIQFNYDLRVYQISISYPGPVARGARRNVLFPIHTRIQLLCEALLLLIKIIIFVLSSAHPTPPPHQQGVDRDRDVGMQITQSTLLLLSESVLAEEK